MKNKLTIIIPVHTINDSVYTYLEKSIGSVLNQKIKSDEITSVIVLPSEYAQDIDNFLTDKFCDLKSTITVLTNSSEDYSFQSQINFAVENIKTEYFTILEFDDELANTYFKNFDKYINFDEQYKNIDILMPIVIEVDKNGNVFKMTNNLIWSKQLVDNGRFGYLTVDALKEYSDFKLSGSIIKRETFLNVGGLKKNIKLSFNLEFLLRLINFGNVVYNLPKILYLHVDGREDSLFDIYNKTLSKEDRKFWFETAYKEYFFQADRIIQQPSNNI